MKLSFSTNAFTKFSLAETLDIVAGIGYQGVEIMADRPHFWPPDLDENQVGELRRRAGELNLALCNINGFMMKAVGDVHHPSWIEDDESGRRMRVDHTRACLGLANVLKIPSVSTEPGGPMPERGFERGRLFALFASTIDQVIPVAEELKVKLLIEPEPGLLLEGIDETISFLEDMDSPYLGLNFDAGHFFCVGDNPASLLKPYRSFIQHIHLEDIAASREHRHLIPGRGAIDFHAFFDALKAIDYSGFVTVELYPYEETPQEAAEEAFRFLEPFFEGTL